jgi:uncharacterized membrane protein YbhN (UPF0104 family)
MRALVTLSLKCLFAACSLWLIFRLVPRSDIVEVYAGASGWLFVGALALQFLNRATATVNMQVIARGQGIDISRCALFRILLSVQFYAMFLPGALAGGGATWLKYVEHGAGKSAAAASIIVNRGIGLLVLATMGTLALLVDPVSEAFPRIVLPLLTMVCLACLTLVWIPWKPRISSRITQTGPVPARIGMFLDRLLGFQRLPTSAKAIATASLIVQELGNVAAMWTFGMAIGLHLDFVSVMWMRAGLQAALLLPVSIAGIGIREASLAGLGALVGIQPADAIAWSFMILAGTLGLAVAGGLLEAGAWTRRLTRRRRTTVAGSGSGGPS